MSEFVTIRAWVRSVSVPHHGIQGIAHLATGPDPDGGADHRLLIDAEQAQNLGHFVGQEVEIVVRLPWMPTEAAR